jgi:membrane protein implicated in regulation of membrane protease activity
VAQRAPLRPTSRIEEAIGFVGCFGLLFFGVTVSCELTGRPALGWALALLATVVAVVLLDRWRRRVLRRTADRVAGPDHLPAATRPSGH